MSFAVGRRVRLCLSLLASGVALALGAREARAQSGTVAAARVISLLATKTSQLSVTVTSGAVQSIAYFSTPAQALSGGATQIPSSRVLAQMTTGLPVAFTAITQNAVGGVGTAGGSLRLFAQTISGPNKKSSRTDNLNLQINLVGFPTLAPGTYTGTLNLRAVTQ
jgi:hypothetical protein